jgi:hypothetical protein
VSRRLTIATKEMGKLELYLIYDYGGTWEPEWLPVQDHPIASLFTRVAHDTIEHAILGFSRPLVKGLGLFPKGCLHKMPSQECTHATACTLHVEKDCLSTAKGMPWCFEPAGVGDASTIRKLAAEAVRLWREGVYVVVVEEPADAGQH